jgi:hypothetical protein
MRLGGKNEKISKIKRCILEGNKKFQKRKCAYFSTKVNGKGIFKHISISIKCSAFGTAHFCRNDLLH